MTPARKVRAARGARKVPVARRIAEADRHLRDIALAHQRIGTTVETRARWLLEDFVARDPATLATGELATLRDNLQALAGYGGLTVGPTTGAAMTASMGYDDPVLVDEAALRAVWARVVALTQAHREPVPLPAQKEMFMRLTTGGSYLRLSRRSDVAGLADQIVIEAARVLEGCERLRVCPECDRIFVARRRQERHPKCARQARDRRRPSRQRGA
jgi:hypothetical protein